eukprot:CAMPEP_0170501690 /NCGR_PEP_ID=MMETSP0208-20121228/39115_1 /TAXON_ID=197538 /ORGANISM="Strombidium inclinatum, Strain S3" /LENGTH=51 /DNA_ID=CAMNT_0010780365 /DNA_START=451 /DNA_END=603 /DNA_ORIENTATION=+
MINKGGRGEGLVGDKFLITEAEQQEESPKKEAKSIGPEQKGTSSGEAKLGK